MNTFTLIACAFLLVVVPNSSLFSTGSALKENHLREKRNAVNADPQPKPKPETPATAATTEKKAETPAKKDPTTVAPKTEPPAEKKPETNCPTSEPKTEEKSGWGWPFFGGLVAGIVATVASYFAVLYINKRRYGYP